MNHQTATTSTASISGFASFSVVSSIRRKREFYLLAMTMFASGFTCVAQQTKVKTTENLCRWVDPRIGVSDGSQSSIGVQLPWGSVNAQPDTPNSNFAGYSDRQSIRGFSQMRLTGGGGRAGYGNILISPQVGLAVGEDEHDSPKIAEKAGCPEYAEKNTLQYRGNCHYQHGQCWVFSLEACRCEYAPFDGKIVLSCATCAVAKPETNKNRSTTEKE
jgi:hypothetical protein